jgi:hypothetical protein
MDDRGDRYAIAVEGGVISRLTFDYSITIWIALAEGDTLNVRIGGVLLFTSPDTDYRINAEVPSSACPLLDILHRTPQSLTAYKDGRLELILSDEYRVRVMPDPAFEAWELYTDLSLGLKLVSLPGGGLAVWLPDDPNPKSRW